MGFKVIKENILKSNDNTAGLIRESLSKTKTYMINIISSPGAGKTTLIEKITPLLKDERIDFLVITGDCFTSNDAKRIDSSGASAIQINTGNSCHIDAGFVQKAIEEADKSDVDLIIVENVGNLVCPAEFDVGEDAKIGIISTPEGDDKPLKYPLLFTESELVIINKVDLLEHLPFNIEECKKNIQGVNSDAKILEIAALEGKGLSEFVLWIKERIEQKKEK